MTTVLEPGESTRPTGPREPKVPQVAVATVGARGHYAVPKLLNEAGMLHRLFTDVYAHPESLPVRLLRLIPSRLRPRAIERMLGRFDPELPREKVVGFPTLGVQFWWRRQRIRNTEHEFRIHTETVADLNHRAIRHGIAGVDAVMSYSAASLELFQYARQQGLVCVLEQIGAPRKVERAILAEEMERWPGWEPGLQIPTVDLLQEREEREWGLADCILPASEFTRVGVGESGGPVERCRVVPLGIPLDRFVPRPDLPQRPQGRLRVLFGGQVRLQKGVQYLLEASRLLDSRSVEVRVAGLINLDARRLRGYEGHAEFLGAVPRTRMLELFHWADVFVLPSLCDGFGLAVYEAMACGVPVIVTPNTGAEVSDEVEGLVVPIRDAAAIASAIERFLRDREFHQYCRANTLRNRERLGLDVYRHNLVHAIEDAVRAKQPAVSGR